MNDRIDISAPITELCKLLALNPHDVAEIIFKPDTVKATVYQRNANGGIQLNKSKSAAVSRIIHYDVRT